MFFFWNWKKIYEIKDCAHNPIQCTSIVVSTESVIFHHTASRSVFYPSFCVPISETIIKVLEEEHLQVNLQARSDHFFQVAARRGAPLLMKSVTAMLFSWDGQSTIQWIQFSFLISSTSGLISSSLRPPLSAKMLSFSAEAVDIRDSKPWTWIFSLFSITNWRFAWTFDLYALNSSKIASQALQRRERVGLMSRLPRVKVTRSRHASIGEKERQGSVLKKRKCSVADSRGHSRGRSLSTIRKSHSLRSRLFGDFEKPASVILICAWFG